MDPNATLKALLHDTWLLSNLDVSDGTDTSLVELAHRVAENTQALNDWLANGGFLPDAWRRPLVPAFGVNRAVDELLHTIFTTALEGGIGYWSAALTYNWSVGGEGVNGDLEGFHADIVDADERAGEDNFPQTRIDRSVIARAFERMAAGPIEYMPDGQRYRFLSALYARLAHVSSERYFDFDFDAADADNVVQVGVLGKVVFG
jgi:hypothetical protein